MKILPRGCDPNRLKTSGEKITHEDRGWIRFDKDVVCNAGAKRIESIWLSEKTMEALKKRLCDKELELFPEFGG